MEEQTGGNLHRPVGVDSMAPVAVVVVVEAAVVHPLPPPLPPLQMVEEAVDMAG